MTEEQRTQVRTELQCSAHQLRGSLATLLFLARQFGKPPHDETEHLKGVLHSKLQELSAFADHLDLLAERIGPKNLDTF